MFYSMKEEILDKLGFELEAKTNFRGDKSYIIHTDTGVVSNPMQILKILSEICNTPDIKISSEQERGACCDRCAGVNIVFLIKCN